MHRVPFNLPDVGLREIRGFVYLEDDFLVIELKNALMGEFDEEHELVKVEPSALESVRLVPGIFRDRLRLTPKKVDLLRAIPGDHASDVALRVWRKHREAAAGLVAALQARIYRDAG